jgi:hypothetical protein
MTSPAPQSPQSPQSPRHGIDPAQLKFICLAGSVREYYDWMRKHQVREGESLYASTPTILQGLSTDYDISFHKIGTFEERKDALKILEAVRNAHPEAVIYTDR